MNEEYIGALENVLEVAKIKDRLREAMDTLYELRMRIKTAEHWEDLKPTNEAIKNADAVLETAGYLTMTLDDKGRCCGRKPITYKRHNQLFCDRCDRLYEMTTGKWIPNRAWIGPRTRRRQQVKPVSVPTIETEF